MPTIIFLLGVAIFIFFYIREKRKNEIGHTRRTLRFFRQFPIAFVYFVGAITTAFLIMLAGWVLLFYL